jgi:hypothetical protein
MSYFRKCGPSSCDRSSLDRRSSVTCGNWSTRVGLLFTLFKTNCVSSAQLVFSLAGRTDITVFIELIGITRCIRSWSPLYNSAKRCPVPKVQHWRAPGLDTLRKRRSDANRGRCRPTAQRAGICSSDREKLDGLKPSSLRMRWRLLTFGEHRAIIGPRSIPLPSERFSISSLAWKLD